MAKQKTTNVSGENIDLRDRVDVVATETHPHATKGEKFKVHRKVAEMFLDKGYIDKFE